MELEEAILFFHAVGRSVQLSGLGSFGAGVGLDGKRRILFRPGRCGQAPNASEFRGYMNNAANAGSSQEDLKALWDAAHPDDPLDLTGSIGVSGSGRSAGTSGTESGTGTNGTGTSGRERAGPAAPTPGRSRRRRTDGRDGGPGPQAGQQCGQLNSADARN